MALLLITLGAFIAKLWHTPTPGDAAWYASVQLLDPIFAIDGTDPDKLHAAVTALLIQRDAIARGYAKADEAAGLRKALYPEHFLTLLPQLQRARNALLADPTETHATTYHKLLLSTIDAYATDARTLAQAIHNTKVDNEHIGFLGGTTTPGFIADSVSGAADRAQMQKEKENERFACYQNLTPSCETLQTLQRRQEDSLSTGITLPPPGAKTLNIDGLVGAIIDYSYPHATDLSPIIGVYTDCFPYPVTYLRSYEFPYASGGEVRKAYVANDALFYNVKFLASSTGDTYDKTAYKKGARYEYQNIANSYMCPDAGLYQADLDRIVGALSVAKASSSVAAEHLRSLPYVQLSDAAAFIGLTGDARARAQYLEGSAQFDEWLQALTNDNSYVLSFQASKSSIAYSYMFIGRSYISVLFLFGNPTFVPSRPSLLKATTTQPIDVALTSWRYVLSKTMSTSTILQYSKDSIDIYRTQRVR